MTDNQIDDGQLFIGGQWVPATGNGRMDVIDPSTGTVVGSVASGDATDIAAAVTAARTAFESGPWPAMSGRERSRILAKVAVLIRENADELVRLESLDVGKPVSLCRAVDVATAAEEDGRVRVWAGSSVVVTAQSLRSGPARRNRET